jgi:hypothetical protein
MKLIIDTKEEDSESLQRIGKLLIGLALGKHEAEPQGEFSPGEGAMSLFDEPASQPQGSEQPKRPFNMSELIQYD